LELSCRAQDDFAAVDVQFRRDALMAILRRQIHGREVVIDEPSAEAMARWSGQMSPEPETLVWISGMSPGEVFFDIGANVGRFSITAACRGLRVFSFEPQAQQYAEMCRTVLANRLDVTAYCVALSSGLAVGKITPGRSAATFNASEAGKYQGALSWPLDTFVERLGIWPDHIKLDVDGNEPDIIAGGRATIAQAKSILIEIDPGAPGHGAIIDTMAGLGFGFDPRQVEACREPAGTKFAGMANHIFRKAI
jgi:FkbM family methyltransferase